MAGATLLDKWRLLQSIAADPDLSATAKVVAARLLDYFHSQTGLCCPSYAALASGTALKRRTVIYAVQELEEGGWMSVDRVKGGASSGAGRYATNAFRLDFSKAGSDSSTVHDDAPSRVHDDAPSTVRVTAPLLVHGDALSEDYNSARNGGSRVHEDALSTVHGGAPESSNSTSKETNKSLPHTPSRFDEWWDAYPRKVGKDAARQVFERILKTGRSTADELIEGAERYAVERAGDDPKFTKHPKTWLNGGHWADEPAPRSRPGGSSRGFSATDRFYGPGAPADD